MKHAHPLQPLKAAWLNKIKLAIELKRTLFQDVADQCVQFYCGVVGFMYQDAFRKKYIRGDFKPKFQITLNKAFEVVAVLGPHLYDHNPTRCVKPYRAVEFGPEAFGDPNDPMVQAMYQQALWQHRIERTGTETGCRLAETYLNYTPREQPGGGLKQAASDALTETLVKGRGVLWPEAYRMPGSPAVLTGCFYRSVDGLLIDPDATSAAFGDAYWIAQRYVEPHWVPERQYGLPFGALRMKKHNLESLEAQGARQAHPAGNRQRNLGHTYDLTTYWKIWSIGGVGTRLTGTSQDLQGAFDEHVGDYAHVVVCEGYPSLLNMPTERLGAATVDDVKQAFAWPVDYWRDRRWPCAMLDFYRLPGCAWPISVLRPALGELVALNILITRLLHHVWSHGRNILGVMKTAAKEVEAALKGGGDDVVVELNTVMEDINKVVSRLEQPNIKVEAWQIVELLFEIFDKRTGLADILYGMQTSGVSRSATDIRIRDQRGAVRADHMINCVEDWMTEAAAMEKICAYRSGVSGQDVRPLLGSVGAALWDRHFAGADEETIFREMTCTIEAGSARKPNKERDLANLQQVYPAMSQQFAAYADRTGDSGQLNRLNALFCEALDMDPAGLQMGPWMPPPAPEGQVDPEGEERRQDMKRKEEEHEQKMRHREAEHEQKAKAAKAKSKAKAT